jgi:hypothetical protein
MKYFSEIVGHVEGIQLSELTPLTTLVVWTWNTQYRFTIVGGRCVCVQGGTFFPDPTSARLDGASRGGGSLIDGWICVGLNIELRAGHTRIMTSPVVAIAAESDPPPIVH